MGSAREVRPAFRVDGEVVQGVGDVFFDDRALGVSYGTVGSSGEVTEPL